MATVGIVFVFAVGIRDMVVGVPVTVTIVAKEV